MSCRASTAQCGSYVYRRSRHLQICFSEAIWETAHVLAALLPVYVLLVKFLFERERIQFKGFSFESWICDMFLRFWILCVKPMIALGRYRWEPWTSHISVNYSHAHLGLPLRTCGHGRLRLYYKDGHVHNIKRVTCSKCWTYLHDAGQDNMHKHV